MTDLRSERSAASALAVCVLGCLSLGVAAAPCVSVRITNCYGRTQRVADRNTTLCAEARIHPDKDHRWVEWDWSYPDETTSLLGGAYLPPAVQASPDDIFGMMGEEPFASLDTHDGPTGKGGEQLYGDQWPVDGVYQTLIAPSRHTRKMAGLSGGEYVVTATVYKDAERKKICGRGVTRVVVR